MSLDEAALSWGQCLERDAGKNHQLPALPARGVMGMQLLGGWMGEEELGGFHNICSIQYHHSQNQVFSRGPRPLQLSFRPLPSFKGLLLGRGQGAAFCFHSLLSVFRSGFCPRQKLLPK